MTGGIGNIPGGGGTGGTGGVGGLGGTGPVTNPLTTPTDTISPALSEENLRIGILANSPQLPADHVSTINIMKNVSDAVRTFTEELNNAEIGNWEKISKFMQDIINRANALEEFQRTFTEKTNNWKTTTQGTANRITNAYQDFVDNDFGPALTSFINVLLGDQSPVLNVNIYINYYNNLAPGETPSQATIDAVNAFNTYLASTRPDLIADYDIKKDILKTGIEEYNAMISEENDKINLINQELEEIRSSTGISITELPDLQTFATFPPVVDAPSVPPPTPPETEDVVNYLDLQQITIDNPKTVTSPQIPLFQIPTLSMYSYDGNNILEPAVTTGSAIDQITQFVSEKQLEQFQTYLNTYGALLAQFKESTLNESLTFQQLGKPLIDPFGFTKPENNPLISESGSSGGIGLMNLTSGPGSSIERSISQGLKVATNQERNIALASGVLSEVTAASAAVVASALSNVLGRTLGQSALSDPILLALIASATGTTLSKVIDSDAIKILVDKTAQTDDQATKDALMALIKINLLLIPLTQLGHATGLPNLAAQALTVIGALDEVKTVGGLAKTDDIRQGLIDALVQRGVSETDARKQANAAIDLINAQKAGFSLSNGPMPGITNPGLVAKNVIDQLMQTNPGLAAVLTQGMVQRSSLSGVNPSQSQAGSLVSNVEDSIITTIAKKFRTEREFTQELIRELIRRGFSTSGAVFLAANVSLSARGDGAALLTAGAGSTEKSIKFGELGASPSPSPNKEATDLAGVLAQVNQNLGGIMGAIQDPKVVKGVRDQILTNTFGGTAVNAMDKSERKNPLSLLNTNFQSLVSAIAEKDGVKIDDTNRDKYVAKAKESISAMIDATAASGAGTGVEYAWLQSLGSAAKTALNLASAPEGKGTESNIRSGAPV